MFISVLKEVESIGSLDECLHCSCNFILLDDYKSFYGPFNIYKRFTIDCYKNENFDLDNPLVLYHK